MAYPTSNSVALTLFARAADGDRPRSGGSARMHPLSLSVVQPGCGFQWDLSLFRVHTLLNSNDVSMKYAGLLLMCLTTLATPEALADPPFSGTIFIDPDIITASDPTT